MLAVLAFKDLPVDGLTVDSLLLALWPGLLTEYGPAVAGLAGCSGRRNFVGRIGATDRPPCATVVITSGRGRTGAASDDVDEFEAVEDDETVRIGEKIDIAEPGRAGRLLFAIAAFF
jgi:hypothetical protein